MGSAQTKWVIVSAALAILLSSCSRNISDAPQDEALVNLQLLSVQPSVIVPGTRMVIEGRSFVQEEWGQAELVFHGTFRSDHGDETLTDFSLPLAFVDFDHYEYMASSDSKLYSTIDDATLFNGELSVRVLSRADNQYYTSESIRANLDVQTFLDPIIGDIQSSNLVFINSEIAVTGNNFLLGGAEGSTFAVVNGCFTLDGQAPCAEVEEKEIPLIPESEFDRTRASFAFSPEIAGIRGGAFRGRVSFKNSHASGRALSSISKEFELQLAETTIFGLNPSSVSLGQYLFVDGGGFIGSLDENADGLPDDPSQETLLQLQGMYTIDRGERIPLDLLLIPEFTSGSEVRYVLNQADALGQAIDLVKETGRFTGQILPIIRYKGEELRGSSPSQEVNLRIAPVKQVVFLRFTTTYVESLRHFGLRAMREQIKERVVKVIERDYATINLEVRTEEPTDFAKYSIVEVSGRDPNGIGLLGYDNTPGKDINNERLDDILGGANAQTNADGLPQFGGVFIESLFIFSPNPGQFSSTTVNIANTTFDEIFDPFRPDREGKQVRAADLADGFQPIANSSSCPTANRTEQIQCAVFVLGSLIGTTLSHEIGHSLGLARPFGSRNVFHNQGDKQNRLMDSGDSRPFAERAELLGEGPGVFCEEWYQYLRNILPTDQPPTTLIRPSCS